MKVFIQEEADGTWTVRAPGGALVLATKETLGDAVRWCTNWNHITTGIDRWTDVRPSS
jgi:hypothetical protein